MFSFHRFGVITLALVLAGCASTEAEIGDRFEPMPTRVTLRLHGWSVEETIAIEQSCEMLNEHLLPQYRCAVAMDGETLIALVSDEGLLPQGVRRWDYIDLRAPFTARDAGGAAANGVLRLLGVTGTSTCGLTDDRPKTSACWSRWTAEDVQLCKDAGRCF